MSELLWLIGSGTSFGILGLGLILLTNKVDVAQRTAEPIPLKARSKRSF